MATLIGSMDTSISDVSPLVMRKSNESIIVVYRNSSSITVGMSDDGGSTWSTDTLGVTYSRADPSTCIDSNDVFHTVAINDNDDTQLLYHQWTADVSNGTTSVNVADEIVYNGSNQLNHSAGITVASDDTIYTAGPTSSSTASLFERTGSGSWTDHGSLGDMTDVSITADANDDCHIGKTYSVFDGQTITYYLDHVLFDSSTGTFTTDSVFSQNTTLADSKILMDTDGLPVLACRYSTLTVRIFKETDGTWSSDDTTDDSPSFHDIGLNENTSEIYNLYETSGSGIYGTADDIRENHAAFGNFDQSAETTLQNTSDAEINPIVRYQFYNLNDPGTPVLDYVFENSTTGEIYYDSLELSSGTTSSVSPLSVTASPTAGDALETISGTVTLDASGVQGAPVYLVDTTNDTIVATTTTDSNGDYSFSANPEPTYHVVTQYDDGSTQYQAESKPYIEL